MHPTIPIRSLQVITLISAVLGSAAVWALPLTGAGRILNIPHASTPHETPAQAALRRGVQALQGNNLAAAESAFKESIQADATLIGPLLGMAEIALRKNSPGDAEPWLRKAEVIAPDSAEIQTAWGRIYYAQQEFAKAIDAFKKAIALDAKMLAPRLDLADLYMARQRPEDAVQAYRNALGIDPDDAGAHYGLGRALVASGDPAAAAGELRKAAKLAPENPLPLQALAKLYASQQQYDKALDSLNKALRVQPDFAPAQVTRGDIYILQGEVAKAIAAYQGALKSAPNNGYARMQLASAYQRQERYSAAEVEYLAALDSEPGNALIYNNLAWMAVERNTRLNDALAWAKKAVELEPAVAQFQDTLGWVYRGRGELDKAARTLAQAATIKPPQADIHYHLGVVYQEMGKKQQAAAAFKKALALQHPYPEAERALRKLDNK